MYQDHNVEYNSLIRFVKISSVLDNFPNETANSIAQSTIPSLKGFGCPCFNTSFITGKNANAHVFPNRDSVKEGEREKEKRDHLVSNQLVFPNVKSQTVSLKYSLDVNWVLEVMKHSINMPLFIHIEVVKHTVHIYCSWLLEAMCGVEKNLRETESDTSGQVPSCIRDNVNDYAPLFIASLCKFFKNFIESYSSSILGAGMNPVNAPSSPEQKVDNAYLFKEANNLIERVLTTVEQIATSSNRITSNIWDSLLYFCLTVGKYMLSGPSEPNLLTFSLADRISCMVFKIWLQACSKYFPRPSLWKTFNKYCQTWRHQEAFITQWNKINAAFTNRLLSILHKNASFPNVPGVDSATNEMIPSDLSDSCIKDCWYRFLNIIGNPVDICQPKLVFSPDIMEQKSHRRPSSQSTLNYSTGNLPNIFHRAMHGLSIIVDAFLGSPRSGSGFVIHEMSQVSSNQLSISSLPKISQTSIDQTSPPEIRKVTGQIFTRKQKTGPTRMPPLVSGSTTIDHELSVDTMPDPHPLRPEANSLLRLFGNWLFEASIVGVKQSPENSVISIRASSIEPSKFNAGRAEACGALCRIITHCHRNNINMDYLTKFYIVIFLGLDIEPATASSLVLSSILFNTIDILRIGLVGVHILVPRLFRGVEFVLSNEFEKPDLISKNQLRRAAIHHILSMISLPSYFVNLEIKPLLPPTIFDKQETFLDIRKSMSLLLSDNIKTETDHTNLQMLIGCLMAYLENLAKEELLELNVGKTMDIPSGERIDNGSDIFNHALVLLSMNLVHKWKDEMNILQFALETLSDMAKLKFKHIDIKICKRAIRFLCEFIENQMARKNKEHSRQLHNIIISGYYCLALWLVHHPNLLDDGECLKSVLEISELGISGSKSRTHHSNGCENSRLKHSKQLSPASKRVQVVAEYLLHCIMSEMGAVPGLVGIETTGSLVNEELLLKEVSSSSGDENQFFRYFGLDNDIILALLEKPLNKQANPNEPLPTLSVVIRTSFGRYVWEMRSRQLPGNVDLCDMPVPVLNCFNGVSILVDKLFKSRPYNTGIFKQMFDFQNVDVNDEDPEPVHFPDIMKRVDPFKVEFSIPKLESLLDDSERNIIETAIKDNLKIVNSVRSSTIKTRQDRSKNCSSDLQCKKLIPVSEFQTARLLLYHMGYLSVNAFLYDNSSDNLNYNTDQENKLNYNRISDTYDSLSSNISTKSSSNVMSQSNSLLPTFFPLDSSTSNFFSSLDVLDKASSRSADTCLIFYVKAGQTDPSEIIANHSDWPNFSTDFLAILLSLGWLVDVSEHSGWTGNIETSYHMTQVSKNVTSSLSRGSSKYRNKIPSSATTNSLGVNANIPKELLKLINGPIPDGSSCTIYWADSQKEVSFLVASNEDHLESNGKVEFGIPLPENAVTPTGGSQAPKEFGVSQTKIYPEKSKDSGMAVTLVWIEKWNDVESINISSLVGKDRSAILVCPTPEGLFRIKVHRPVGKHFCAGPLFSGMILDIKNIGTLIRQTVVNINRRIRQDSENYFASHFQRSQKLQHIITEHRLHQSTSQLPDLFTSLLYPPICRTEPRF